MATYRKTLNILWEDPVMEKLNPEERFFLIFLYTNPLFKNDLTYQIPIEAMIFYTGLHYSTILELLDKFISLKIISYLTNKNLLTINTPNTNDKSLGKVVKEDISLFSSCKMSFLDFYKETFSTEYYFSGKDAKHLKALINKIEFKINESRTELNSKIINDSFNEFLYKSFQLGSFFIKTNFNLSIIDSKFNELYALIKQSSKDLDHKKMNIGAFV